MSGYNDNEHDEVRNPDEIYCERLIDHQNNQNNMSEEEQLAFILMQSEEDYERNLIASQIEEIEKNVRLKNEEIEQEKERRTKICDPMIRYLYYSSIPTKMLNDIRIQLKNYKEMETDKIEFELEMYNKFKNYVEVMKLKFGRYGINIYEDIHPIVVCKI